MPKFRNGHGGFDPKLKKEAVRTLNASRGGAMSREAAKALLNQLKRERRPHHGQD